MVSNERKSTHPPTIEHFYDDLNSLIVSPEKIAIYLGLSADDLAQAAQIDPSAMRDQPSSSEIQSLLRNIVRTLAIAGEIFESSDSAITWLVRERISAFHNETALTRICRGRTEDVIWYLHSIGSGYVG